MEHPELNVVTGAFGYTGKYITRRLLTMGKRVITLTGHQDRPDPFGGQVEVYPLDFNNAGELTRSLKGAAVLYNTYWVRFPRGQVTYDRAVENTRALVKAAEEAGVRRIVHVSITNASDDSSLPYFRGKGLLEKAIMHSRLSYAIIRPTVIFGTEGILLNNIAWLLRRFPLFVIAGSGDYRLQPIFVEDMAEIAVSAAQRDDNTIMDAAGPETYTFEGLVRLIADKVNRPARIIHLGPGMAFFFSRLIGLLVNDVVLTRDEVGGLTANLLISKESPKGHTRLSEWLSQNTDSVGARYISEMAQHYR